jgi:hypothetical protein
MVIPVVVLSRYLLHTRYLLRLTVRQLVLSSSYVLFLETIAKTAFMIPTWLLALALSSS